MFDNDSPPNEASLTADKPYTASAINLPTNNNNLLPPPQPPQCLVNGSLNNHQQQQLNNLMLSAAIPPPVPPQQPLGHLNNISNLPSLNANLLNGSSLGNLLPATHTNWAGSLPPLGINNAPSPPSNFPSNGCNVNSINSLIGSSSFLSNGSGLLNGNGVDSSSLYNQLPPPAPSQYLPNLSNNNVTPLTSAFNDLSSHTSLLNPTTSLTSSLGTSLSSLANPSLLSSQSHLLSSITSTLENDNFEALKNLQVKISEEQELQNLIIKEQQKQKDLMLQQQQANLMNNCPTATSVSSTMANNLAGSSIKMSNSLKKDPSRCNTCCERFNLGNRQPKILCCTHTFCMSCLCNMVVPGNQVKCPRGCTVITQLTEGGIVGLTTNQGLVPIDSTASNHLVAAAAAAAAAVDPA